MQRNLYQEYLEALKTDYIKIAKLEFLNPDGSVFLALDNDPANEKSLAFIQDGSFSCNLNNGKRRQMSVVLCNASGDFDFDIKQIWFGQQIRYSEGLILSDGTEFYLPQGVFEIEQPSEKIASNEKTVSFNLTDKWANIDGTLGGELEGDYFIKAGSNVFQAISTLLRLDRFTYEAEKPDKFKIIYVDGKPYVEFLTDDVQIIPNGDGGVAIDPGESFTLEETADGGVILVQTDSKAHAPIDSSEPIFTSYYNNMTQRLTDGTEAPFTLTPYDISQEGNGTIGGLILALTETLAGLAGYNATGRLTLDPSQDNISDASKPVLWDFHMDEKELESIDISVNKSEVYNDVIVVGATLDDYTTARGRAQNLDPTSDTCVSRIGLKTKRIEMPNYYSDDVCEAYAVWMLKKYATVNKQITINCKQMFHIVENQIITVKREDKPGAPTERHVVQGFTRPVSETGSMQIQAVSVNDYPLATIIKDN